ncbi:NAD-dependent epimerase/dehydratase family protein [Nostoc sp. DSM 114160]
MVNSVEKLSGQTILITGASGFLGSHLVRHLCHDGAEVHAVSRSFHPSDIRSLRWWQGDMEDIKFVHNLFHSIKPDPHLPFIRSCNSSSESRVHIAYLSQFTD